jgi:DNA-directed RNA polymerase specialized sigma24 family protein
MTWSEHISEQTLVEEIRPLVQRVVRARVPYRDIPDVVQDCLCAVLQRAGSRGVQDWRQFSAGLTVKLCSRYFRKRYRDWDTQPLADEVASTEVRVVGGPAVLGAEIGEWIAGTLLPSLPAVLGRTPQASARRNRLLRSLASRKGGARESIRQLARDLGCQPAEVRSDILAIAEIAKRCPDLGLPPREHY